MGKRALRELRKVADLLDGIHDELVDLGECSSTNDAT